MEQTEQTEQNEEVSCLSLVRERLGEYRQQIQECRQQEFWSTLVAGVKCRKKDKEENKDKNAGVGKEIGIVYGSYLILNTIIGPGIFTSPKGVLIGCGSVGMSLLIWVICGVFSTMAALCFAELRESVKREGVEYAYITEAFGPLAGFVYCWMRIAAAEPVGTAVFAIALADYTADSIYDDCGPPGMLRKTMAVLAVVSLALLNVFSQKLADRMQVLATIGKTVAIVVIVVFGLKNVFDGKTVELEKGFRDTQTSPTSITFAIYNGLWAYGGWSNVNHVTSGIKKAPRNVPRLVKTVIPLVMILYGLVVTSYFTVMSRDDMIASEAIGVTWAERVLDGAMAIIPIGVGLTALGSLNATFLSAGRLSGVAVKDRNMPEVTSWVHVRSKTPILTVYTRLMIAIIMIMVAEIAALIRFFIFSVWLFHGMSVLALLVLRFKNKDKVRPYKVNLILPVIVVAVIGFLLIGPFLEEPQPEFISSLVLIFLSLVCYYPMHWINNRMTLPDKFIVWLQLFFRIAPKRSHKHHHGHGHGTVMLEHLIHGLRHTDDDSKSQEESDLRRKSILRRMSSLARNSILIPAGASPATIRRIQGSPTLLRRVSRVSRISRMDGASPPTWRRNAGSPSLARRVNRHRSFAEGDLKRSLAGGRIAWLETGQGGSPAIVRRRFSRQSQSFGAADGKLPKLESMPNLRQRGSVAGGESSTDEHSCRVTFSVGDPNSPAFVRSSRIATAHLPPGVTTSTSTSNNNNQKQTDTAISGNLSNLPNGSVVNLQGLSHMPTLQEVPQAESSVVSDGNLTPSPSEQSLQVVGGFESEGGGEYEILALPPRPDIHLSDNNSDSDSDSSSSDDLQGIGSLFESSTSTRTSDSSDLDEEGSNSDGRDFTDDELDSDLDEIIFTNLDDRTVSYI